LKEDIKHNLQLPLAKLHPLLSHHVAMYNMILAQTLTADPIPPPFPHTHSERLRTPDLTTFPFEKKIKLFFSGFSEIQSFCVTPFTLRGGLFFILLHINQL
jgi:hypothetical protein